VIYLKIFVGCHSDKKLWRLESPQEAVKVIETVSEMPAICLGENKKTTLNPEAPVAIAKGNAIAKGITPDELRILPFR
jgi:DNA mismatch repair protein MutS